MHRTPNIYNEMLEVVSDLETKEVGHAMPECVTYNIHVDGSVDRQAIDNKFVTVRLMGEDGRLQGVLGVEEPETSGASGLLEAFKSSLESAVAPLEKLVGVATDGEAA